MKKQSYRYKYIHTAAVCSSLYPHSAHTNKHGQISLTELEGAELLIVTNLCSAYRPFVPSTNPAQWWGAGNNQAQPRPLDEAGVVCSLQSVKSVRRYCCVQNLCGKKNRQQQYLMCSCLTAGTVYLTTIFIFSLQLSFCFKLVSRINIFFIFPDLKKMFDSRWIDSRVSSSLLGVNQSRSCFTWTCFSCVSDQSLISSQQLLPPLSLSHCCWQSLRSSADH